MAQPEPLLDGFLFLGFLAAVTVAGVFFSRFMTHVFSGGYSRGFLGMIETRLYHFIGTSADTEEGWKGYVWDMLIFNGIGFFVLFSLLLLQGYLPLNPEGFSAFDLRTAIHAAVSFVTNTNYQIYAGEVSASYLTQMAGFAVQNFLSAATGICIAVAVMRGITRRSTDRIGNFWVDMTRCVLYILLPVAFIIALLLVSQGVVQNFDPYVHAVGYGPAGPQTIAMGPVASQEAIKEFGTNGGGFFNANSAHPYENPTPFTNLVEIFLILLIPTALPFVFGRMAGSMRQGWAIYAVMLVIYLSALGVLYTAELGGNPLMGQYGVTGISMEGKEVRFGLGGTALFAASTTATSCGAVNALFDSFMPIAGMIPMFLILLGEVAFGGVGSGFYTFIGFIVVAVFIAGLMIGRTPEYPRQEDRGSGDAHGRSHGPGAGRARPRPHGSRPAPAGRDRSDAQPGPARPLRTHLHLCLHVQQQRECICRVRRIRYLLRTRRRRGDGHRAVRSGGRNACPSRIDGRKEGRSTGTRNAANRLRDVHRLDDPRDPDRRGAHLLPALRHGADCRSPAPVRRRVAR